MKLKKIIKKTYNGVERVFDISVDEVHHYLLEDGTVSHNSGSLYNSSIIVELSKAQDKGVDGVIGAVISATSVKNRLAKEKKKVKFTINFDKGLLRYSGLMEYGLSKKVFSSVTADGKPKAIPKGAEKKPGTGVTFIMNTFTGEIISKNDLTDIKWEEILQGGLADFMRKDFAYQSDAEGILNEGEGVDDEIDVNEE